MKRKTIFYKKKETWIASAPLDRAGALLETLVDAWLLEKFWFGPLLKNDSAK